MKNPTTTEAQPLVRGTQQPEPLPEGALNPTNDPAYRRDWRAVAIGLGIATTIWVSDMVTTVVERQDMQGEITVSTLAIGGLAYIANLASNASPAQHQMHAPQA